MNTGQPRAVVPGLSHVIPTSERTLPNRQDLILQYRWFKLNELFPRNILLLTSLMVCELVQVRSTRSIPQALFPC